MVRGEAGMELWSYAKALGRGTSLCAGQRMLVSSVWRGKMGEHVGEAAGASQGGQWGS